ncbi:signal-transducing adaptor protein 2b [Triplophysa dalaica]|uniref:signal-transducing adaptor protein 2b n=1 Tax=Triplophysa dalaica TaxID=1582913 RepID=UPI0024DFB944|nr:signal-transducing adaptor protein 2b [Triplophysa dalaica]
MATPKRTPRVRSQLPQCYHEGFLEKKSIKDKVGRKLWTSLCGKSLFFFNSTKDSVYIEKLDLSDLLSVSDDGCRDRKLDSARFTLHMKNDDIKMIAPSLEARELWKGFMLSVAKLSLPASLNLLPGQIHMMKEVIKKEKIRLASYSSPDCHLYLPVISEMPACYYNVSRTEAELRLEKNPERGNLLLRPSKEGASFAITTREDVNGSVFKHYRVSRRPEGGFSIDIEIPIPCSTLHDVINCMEKKTNGVFKRFLMEDHYEETIKYFKANEENGELTVHDVPNSHLGSPPAPPSKAANEETFETSVCQATKGPLPSPPAPPPKPVKRDQIPDVDTSESIYLNEPGSPCEFSEDEGDFTCTGPPVVPRQPVRLPHQNSMPSLLSAGGEKVALKPPGYPNHCPRSQSVSDMFENKSQQGSKPPALAVELKLFFKNRKAIPE